MDRDAELLTRGQFLAAAGGAAAGFLALAPGSARAEPGAERSAAPAALGGHRDAMSFHSRPDLRPPHVSARHPHGGPDNAGGRWLLTPGNNAGNQSGPLVLDGRGNPLWFRPVAKDSFATNLRVQHYRGQPVLTWWEGKFFGYGEGVVVDSSYRELARVRAGNGRGVDPHELLLTPEGTALITCSAQVVQADLSSLGGSRHGQVYGSVIQEVDVESGRLVMEWRSLDHVPVTESYLKPKGPYDYMHANSIDITPDGHLLVSGRHTWALYKVHRRTGRVLWRLGGKRSDFEMGRRAQFAWQHHAHQVDSRTITVFDNEAGVFGTQPWRQRERQSRAVVLEVDAARHTVRLARRYRHHPPLLTTGYGSVQRLPDGETVIGWGDAPAFSHVGQDGTVVGELALPAGYASYRGFRQHWRGMPADRPAAALIRGGAGGHSALYASWNGATEVAAWEVQAGAHPASLRPVARTGRAGFETAVPVPVSDGYAAAAALDRHGHRLATSQAVKL